MFGCKTEMVKPQIAKFADVAATLFEFEMVTEQTDEADNNAIEIKFFKLSRRHIDISVS